MPLNPMDNSSNMPEITLTWVFNHVEFSGCFYSKSVSSNTSGKVDTGMIANNCNWFLDQMSAYIDGELDSNTTTTIDSHLSICPACKQQYQKIEMIQSQIGREWGNTLLPSDIEVCRNVESIMFQIENMESGYVASSK